MVVKAKVAVVNGCGDGSTLLEEEVMATAEGTILLSRLLLVSTRAVFPG